MSILYLDIEKWKKCDRKALQAFGNSDLELAESIVQQLREVNEYILDGIIVVRFEDILPEIMRQYSERAFFSEEYWNDNSTNKCLVYCLMEDFVLTYDYFLWREHLLKDGIQYYYEKRTGKKEKIPQELLTDIVFCRDEEIIKPSKVKLIRDIEKIEIIDLAVWNEDIRKGMYGDQYVDRMKKQLFTAKKYSVQAKIEEVLRLNMKKITHSNGKKDYLQLVFWIYYLDRHGIEKNGQYIKMGILDIMDKPRIQIISDYRKHTTEIEAATYMNMFKNLIVRHIAFDRINEIERIFRKINDFYNAVFNYMAKVMMDDKLTLDKKIAEYENLASRVKKSIDVVENVKSIEEEKKYEHPLWEMIYIRYKSFIERCRKEDSIMSLEYAYNIDKPTNIRFYDTCHDDTFRVGCVPFDNLKEFIELNASYIAVHVSDECDVKWIMKNYERIQKYYSIVSRFNTINSDKDCPVTMIISMYQIIDLLEKKRLKYENNYKNYKGNKNVSILAKLDSSDVTTSESEAFDYVLMALLKRYFHYNELNLKQWDARTEMELSFEKMINNIMELDSLIDMEVLIEGLYVEFAFPESAYVLDVKKERERDFKERTGYELDIQDFGLIRDFQKDFYFDYFIEQMQLVLLLNEEYDRPETFHLNQHYVALELNQNILKKKVEFRKCKYMRIGKSYDLLERALNLHLPWFTEKFDEGF